MKKLLAGIFSLLLILTLGVSASAMTIMDTGPGPVATGGVAVAPTEWVAAWFQVLEEATVTDIYGWFYPIVPLESFVISLYSSTGDNQIDDQLFTGNFTMQPGSATDWYGLTGLDWTLNPGYYWVSFEALSPAAGWVIMPTPSPDPSPYHAWSQDQGASWTYYGPGLINIGIQILGEPSSNVPLPGAVWLLGSGLMGLIGLRRKLSS